MIKIKISNVHLNKDELNERNIDEDIETENGDSIIDLFEFAINDYYNNKFKK
jgi:hypothetical protein